MLTNRTYQIIAGAALLVLLVLLYVTNTESDESAKSISVNNESSKVESSSTVKGEQTNVKEESSTKWNSNNLSKQNKLVETNKMKDFRQGKGHHPDKVQSGRNKRSVWTVTTKPYKEAHFATYPPDLIEPCILAGCPEEVCVKCETPYERKMEVGGYDKEHQRRSGGDADGNYYGESTKDYASAKAQDASETKRRILESMREKKDLGLEKQCDCESNETKAGTVLDPFGGSGTTGLVADRNGRNAVLIELNPEYAEMAKNRIYNDAPLFSSVKLIKPNENKGFRQNDH